MQRECLRSKRFFRFHRNPHGLSTGQVVSTTVPHIVNTCTGDWIISRSYGSAVHVGCSSPNVSSTNRHYKPHSKRWPTRGTISNRRRIGEIKHCYCPDI